MPSGDGLAGKLGADDGYWATLGLVEFHVGNRLDETDLERNVVRYPDVRLGGLAQQEQTEKQFHLPLLSFSGGSFGA